MGLLDTLRRLSLRQVLGQHAALSLTKWGTSRAIAQVVLKLGAKRAAVGVATTGVATLTVQHQLDEARRNARARGLEGEVISTGDEVAWFNAAVRPIWEHLDAGLRRVIRDELEPALQRRVPLVGRYLYFSRLSLGRTAPRLGPVHVTRSGNRVKLNFGFEFSGDGAVEFSAGPATLEVVDIRVRGSFEVALGPLVDALNPCGGVTIACLDRPSIDLKIRTGIEVVPNLYDLVRETVDDVVASTIVVPNGIAVPIPTFGPQTDVAELRYPAPKGLLSLEILAVDVVEDASAASSSTASAKAPSRLAPRWPQNGRPLYVRVQVGASTWRAVRQSSFADRSARGFASLVPAGATRGKAANGEGTHDFLVYSEDQTVHLQVFRDASLRPDAFLGHARVPVHALAGAGGEEAVDATLSGADEEDVRCAVRLRARWHAVLDDVSDGEHRAKERRREDADNDDENDSADEAASLLASFRVDDIAGLPPLPGARYTVRAVTGSGEVAETLTGASPPLLQDTVGDDALVALARRLAPALPLADLAEALGIDLEYAREFAEFQQQLRRVSPPAVAPASSSAAAATAESVAQPSLPHGCGVSAEAASASASAEEAAWSRDWCARARAAARRRAASSNPCFGQILHLPSSRDDRLTLEILRWSPPRGASGAGNDGSALTSSGASNPSSSSAAQSAGNSAGAPSAGGAAGAAVVARLSWDLGSLAESGGSLSGPFEASLESGGRCRVRGSLRLRDIAECGPPPALTDESALAPVNQLGGAS